MKDQLFRLVRAVGGFRLTARLTGRSLRILCYHGLWTLETRPFGDRLFMPARMFAARMEWLAASPFPILPLDEAVALLAEDRLPRGAVVVTVDDGWASTYTHMLPVLERLRLPATLYASTYYIERQAPVSNVAVNFMSEHAPPGRYDVSDILDEVRDPVDLFDFTSRDLSGDRMREAVNALGFDARVESLRALAARLGIGTSPWWEGRQFHLMRADELADAARRGMTVQLHTHRHRGVHDDADHLAEEIGDNRAALQNMLGGGTYEHFCYPSGGVHARGAAILAAQGVKSATLIEEGLNPPRTNPFQLRRFLDGRTVAPVRLQAYLSGALDIAGRLR